MKKLALHILIAVGALVTTTAKAAWTLNGTSATDGAWTLTVAADEIGGVVGLKVTGKTMGASTDLDLTTFESDTGSKIIRLNAIFKWNTTVTSANAPTVLRVESGCFQGATKLTSAQFPAATYLGNDCFSDCLLLTSASFSDNITYIGSSCFYQAKISLTNPNWPLLETLGGSAFSAGPVITGDVRVPSLTSLGSAIGGITTIKSLYAPALTNFTGKAFRNSTGFTNITIKGSATALASATGNFEYCGNSPGEFVWLGNEAPTTMPSKSMFSEGIKLFRLYVNADSASTVLAWASYCGATAEQIASDSNYANYKLIAGYDEVKDHLIGFLGTTSGNGKVAAKNSNGPCWIVNTAEVEEETTYHATVTAPAHSSVELVRADGYTVNPDGEGKYEMTSSASIEITYRAEPGYQFEGGLSVYTVSGITAAETIGPEVCDKALAPVTYRTLTLSAADLDAADIASVTLSMTEPYLCVTNGDSIVYSVYDGVALTLTYTAAEMFRFEGGAKTANAVYADGLDDDTVVTASDLPTTSALVCRWTYSGGVVADGNWSFATEMITIDGVTGIRLRQHNDGDGELDFTKFREESESGYDIISTRDWSVFPNGTTRIVAPAILRFDSSCGSGCGVYEIIATNAVYFNYAAFSGCKNLTNVVFSANVKTIGSSAFNGCSALVSLGNTDWPQLTTLGTSAFWGTGITGDLRMPEVTDLRVAFGSTAITSLYAPKCEIFDYQVVYNCKALTNLVIKGSANCFNTAATHQAMTGVGRVETMRYLGETAPTYLPQASIYSAITNTPMLLYVNLKGANSRTDWEKLCTATAAQIKDDPTFAAIKLIPDYQKVSKSLVGFIGDVVTKSGEFVSVRSQQSVGEFTYSGNGPCWVIDADSSKRGFLLTLR